MDVDFGTLREYASSSVDVYGPIGQGLFLKEMGIDARLSMLLENCTGKNIKLIYYIFSN